MPKTKPDTETVAETAKNHPAAAAPPKPLVVLTPAQIAKLLSKDSVILSFPAPSEVSFRLALPDEGDMDEDDLETLQDAQKDFDNYVDDIDDFLEAKEDEEELDPDPDDDDDEEEDLDDDDDELDEEEEEALHSGTPQPLQETSSERNQPTL